MQLLCGASSGVCFMHIIVTELLSCLVCDKVFPLFKHNLEKIGCCERSVLEDVCGVHIEPSSQNKS